MKQVWIYHSASSFNHSVSGFDHVVSSFDHMVSSFDCSFSSFDWVVSDLTAQSAVFTAWSAIFTAQSVVLTRWSVVFSTQKHKLQPKNYLMHSEFPTWHLWLSMQLRKCIGLPFSDVNRRAIWYTFWAALIAIRYNVNIVLLIMNH